MPSVAIIRMAPRSSCEAPGLRPANEEVHTISISDTRTSSALLDDGAALHSLRGPSGTGIVRASDMDHVYGRRCDDAASTPMTSSPFSRDQPGSVLEGESDDGHSQGKPTVSAR